MIAALVSGLLGQIEGMGSLANGASAVASLFGDPASNQATTPQPGSAAPHARHASGITTSPLSDQLQSLLLQQQSETTPNAVAIEDDVAPAASVG